MRELTKEELAVIEKYDISFTPKDGFILKYDNSDKPATSILSIFYKDSRWNIVESIDGKIYIDMKNENEFYHNRQFKNAKIGDKYLFHDGKDSEKVLSRLSKIDKESDKPFITTLGNSFKYIEEMLN